MARYKGVYGGYVETHICNTPKCKAVISQGEHFCEFHVTLISPKLVAEIAEHGDGDKPDNKQSKLFRRAIWRAKEQIMRNLST